MAESTLTMSNGNLSTSSTARSVLPAPVGSHEKHNRTPHPGVIHCFPSIAWITPRAQAGNKSAAGGTSISLDSNPRNSSAIEAGSLAPLGSAVHSARATTKLSSSTPNSDKYSIAAATRRPDSLAPARWEFVGGRHSLVPGVVCRAPPRPAGHYLPRPGWLVPR